MFFFHTSRTVFTVFLFRIRNVLLIRGEVTVTLFFCQCMKVWCQFGCRNSQVSSEVFIS